MWVNVGTSPSPFLVGDKVNLLFSPAFTNAEGLLLIRFSVDLLDISTFLSLRCYIVDTSASKFYASEIGTKSSFGLFLVLFLSVCATSPCVGYPSLRPNVVLARFFCRLGGLDISYCPFFVGGDTINLCCLVQHDP